MFEPRAEAIRGVRWEAAGLARAGIAAFVEKRSPRFT
jgi:hypothetical protein